MSHGFVHTHNLVSDVIMSHGFVIGTVPLYRVRSTGLRYELMGYVTHLNGTHIHESHTHNL